MSGAPSLHRSAISTSTVSEVLLHKGKDTGHWTCAALVLKEVAITQR